MGRLKPGATYIYEKANGVTYAREAGAHPGDRFPIGWDYDVKERDQRAKDSILWAQILLAAKTNPALQDAVDRVKLLYHLSKNNGKE